MTFLVLKAISSTALWFLPVWETNWSLQPTSQTKPVTAMHCSLCIMQHRRVSRHPRQVSARPGMKTPWLHISCSVYGLCLRFIPLDSHFVSSDTLKLRLKICFTVGWKRHLSLPAVLSAALFTFLPLSMSHQECHQPPLWLMPANMATLLSARLWLLSPLFALTLDEFIKGKRKANGRK